jgi:serine/threonine protein kinase
VEQPAKTTSGLSGLNLGSVDKTGFVVQLLLECCELSLRQALDQGAYFMPHGAPHVNYLAVLGTAMDVTRGMAHLHSLEIVHCDIKVSQASQSFSFSQCPWCQPQGH